MATIPVSGRPDLARAKAYTASDAKARLGEVIDRAMTDGVATITRRGRQKFALVPVETLEALIVESRESERQEIEKRYESLLAKMQTPEHRKAVDALFEASSEELGEAAVRAARRC